MTAETYRIIISIAQQQLSLLDAHGLIKQYIIASAKNGVGQIEGSECTPLGKHRIAEKIGGNAPENAIFVGRQWQQEIYTEELAVEQPTRDWILSRILWLDGLEAGFNSGFFSARIEESPKSKQAKQSERKLSCDTKSRYIYIHGCPDSHPMQIPSSHGCIKMRNADVIDLYNRVEVDTMVDIQL